MTEPTVLTPTAQYLAGMAWQKGGIPGSELHVLSTWRCPTTGWELKLQRAEPQGINPSDLLLELIAQIPPVAGQALTDHLVEYREPIDVQYETVTFISGGATVTVAQLLEG